MFGYVKTDIPNMYIKDSILYKAMYCGLCKGIGQSLGQKGRFCLNYDLTFLSVFAHNVMNIDVAIEKQHCVIHPITKRPIAQVDELTKRIGALNIILAYHKLNDNVLDEKKGKLKRNFFKTSYKKARKLEPKLDEIVRTEYDNLLKYEKANTDSIDMASDPFGVMMSRVFEELFNEKIDENLKFLAYNLGKWIYLIDALDDFDSDIKKRNFNVFINCYQNVSSKEQLLKEKRQEIETIFGQILQDIYNSSKEIKYNFNHDLIDNILHRGLLEQTKRVMENKKCKNTIKY